MRIIPNSYGSPRDDLREYNPHHEPAGTSKGGQFARKPGGTLEGVIPPGYKVEQINSGRWRITSPDGYTAAVDGTLGVRDYFAAVAADKVQRAERAEEIRRKESLARRKEDMERLAKAEDQPLPYEPPLGGRPPDDPLALDAEMRDRLTTMDVADEEELGGGINGSYKITLEDGTEAVWKPESGESWKASDIDRDSGDRSNFSVDTDAADEAVSEALAEAHSDAERAYVKEARKQWENGFMPIYHAVLEEYSRAGKLEINPGEGMGVAHLEDRFFDSLLPPDDPDGSMFTEEGLLSDSAESMLRQTLDDMIASGLKAMPQEFMTPDADFFGERSKYFNRNDGYDNWRETPEAEQVQQDAYENAVERQREDWDERRQNEDDEYIRGSITNRDFPQSERDRAAYELDRIVGIGTTPVTVVREHNGERGSVMLWADENLKVAGDRTEHTMRAAILDYLIGNTDRHGGNYIKDGGGLHTIDNGLTFPNSDSELRSQLVDSVVNLRTKISDTLRASVTRGLRSQDWNAWAEGKGMSYDEKEMFLDRVNSLLSGLDEGEEFWRIAANRQSSWF